MSRSRIWRSGAGWRALAEEPQRFLGWAALGLMAAVAGGGAPALSQPSELRLGLPIACRPGVDCTVQNYFDHDPSGGARDHRCGTMTYDGHDGIDIRLPDTAAQRRGVAVLAAAGGTVKAVRDGQPDRALGPNSRAEVAGRECGNGVVLSHPGGWETQYCHMAQGSLSVKPGQRVEAGARLGNVGLSGWTQFPHVHLAVRKDGKVLDPFAADATRCGDGSRVLWTGAAASALSYASPQLLNIGFAAGPVTMEAVESGAVGRPNRSSAALVGYARTIGLQAGDRMELALFGPDGQEVVRSAQPPLPSAKAQWLMFAGDRRDGAAWPSGRYRLEHRVTRGGRAVLTRTTEITL